MKKSKFSLMALAAVAALTSAFASGPDCFQCEHETQYKLISGTFYPAGVFGQDFDCDEDITKTCTYYIPTGQSTYSACRSGVFNDWTGRAKK